MTWFHAFWILWVLGGVACTQLVIRWHDEKGDPIKKGSQAASVFIGMLIFWPVITIFASIRGALS